MFTPISRHFFLFGVDGCGCKDSDAFPLFLEFGLLPLLSIDPMMLAPFLRELTSILLQTCEGPRALEVLLSWRCLLLVFEALKPRLERYAQAVSH